VRRDFYRCLDCLTPQVVEYACAHHKQDRIESVGATCACGGKIEHIGVVRRHRIVRLGQHPPCDARCTNATGPSCDCQCGGEHHGSGRVVTVVAADLGPARLTAVDASIQTARADEYRSAKITLDTVIRNCRFAWAFEAVRTGERINPVAWRSVAEVRTARAHALHLKTHNGRIRAIRELTEKVRGL
jgi:hypothetical protein